jgi:hypothetical protein
LRSLEMRMPTAKFVSAIFVNIFAGLLLATAAHGEPAAADGCLSVPWGDAPAGSHWRYHIDHVNKRNCWYLRQDGGGLSQASPQSPKQAQQNTIPPAPPSPPAKPSVADARAELRPQAGREDNAPADPPAGAAGNPANIAVNQASSANASVWNATAAVATRWPEMPAAAMAKTAATTAANDAAAPSIDPAKAVLPSIPFANLSLSVRPQTFWILIAAVIGAVAFAGLAALVSRRGRSRRRLRRRVAQSTRARIWETTDDDRIVLSDQPYPDVREYRPRFGRGAGAAAAPGGRPREFVSRAPRYARR